MLNYQHAQRSLHLAVIMRDSAKWHAQRGFPDAAATCRLRMRAAAKATINSVRAMEAIAARQAARDLTGDSFAPLSPFETINPLAHHAALQPLDAA